MSDESNTTTDHDTIRKWIEGRGGKPAGVKGTGEGGDDAGLLRVEFSGHGDESGLEEISWEEFFDKFDDNKLAFLHQDKTADGDVSRFCKFVRR